jgi:hypothetical protein
LTRAEKAADKAIHPAVRASEAEANRAHEVDMAARNALLRFRPRSTAEAIAFLQFLASDPSLPRETEMARCLRNIAASLHDEKQINSLTIDADCKHRCPLELYFL